MSVYKETEKIQKNDQIYIMYSDYRDDMLSP